MFFTFLNKDDSAYLDLSLLTDYNPEDVLFYFYNSTVKIDLATCTQFLEIIARDTNSVAICNEWADLLEEIGLWGDVPILAENVYISVLGPYYYPKTNSRFYIYKENPTNQNITSEDLLIILMLDNIITTKLELQNYCKSKKANRKTPKTKNELLKDIIMCINSLREIACLNRHMNYLNKLLEQRYNMVNNNFRLIEPEVPAKPQRPEEVEKNLSNLIPFNVVKRREKQKDSSSYNYEMKVYIIKYREYEKACERYKDALKDWDQKHSELLARCLKDIHDIEKKLKNALKSLDIYNSILRKSFVYSDYQDTATLETFKYYLETGRADGIAECMNLFEEECRWQEIKASQERIENTIYFFQNENENTRFADEHINNILNKRARPPVNG